MVPASLIIESSHLVFVKPTMPGIYRKGSPGKFYYVDKNGARIEREADLQRIKSLVIPPAWKDVWISPKKNGYLQCTGIDAAGRKQYRYHPDWTSRRSAHKYFRLLEFGKALPKARQIIAKDLKRKKFDERKVLAICTEVMQQTLIRIGNECYQKTYGSYGLSTLKDKHVKEKGNEIALSFLGKKGVKQDVALNDSRLAKLVKRCKDISGQELFQYYVNEKEHKPIDSGMLNQYIREVTNCDFTAKDFRTWGGTLEAMRQLAWYAKSNPEMPKKKVVVEVLDQVAAKLGNTRAVCKRSYVYPAIFEDYEANRLEPYLKKFNRCQDPAQEEKILLRFLKDRATESL